MDNTTPESPKKLFQTERQLKMAALAQKQGRLDVNQLATDFDVTTETVRRDLSDLQKQRVVRRVHGGAVLWEDAGFEPLLSVRDKKNEQEKRRIGDIAVQEIPSEGTVIIDSGSTLHSFARRIPIGTTAQVVTNSLQTAKTLAEHANIRLVVLGGTLRKNTLAMVDMSTVTAVQQLNVDTLFVSCDGLTEEGLTTPYRAEAALKSAMIQAARRTVALVDHSKIGRGHLMTFANWSEIDVLITDSRADLNMVETIRAQGPSVLLA